MTAVILVLSVASSPDATADVRSSRIPYPGDVPDCGPDTLWVFDADFEDLTGDNLGWTAHDMSGTVAQVNRWHRDTIRLGGHPHLGESAWWCGAYSSCWMQSRGYGNGWTQILRRDFPLATWSAPGDSVSLEFDQRFAMERDYDKGYVDVSTDNGSSWTTVASYTNPPAASQAGRSVDWDDVELGHAVLGMSDYAGSDLTIRFRFESDGAFSSQDQFNQPPWDPCLDGAWQLDNFAWMVNEALAWGDDCESSGDNGWLHEDLAGGGGTGVTFWRAQLGFDLDITEAVPCRGGGQWVYAAVNPVTGRMADGESAWLMSPPIDISGAERLVAQWHLYADAPGHTGDLFDVWVSSSDDPACVQDLALFVDEAPGAWYGDPGWGTWTDDWTAQVGRDWLGVCWRLWDERPGVLPVRRHGLGILLDRLRVGVTTSYGVGPSIEYPIWDRFHDWFENDLADAIEDTALIRVADFDGVASVWMRASVDDWQTWTDYTLLPPQSGDLWRAPPPSLLMEPGGRVRYYFVAEDYFANVSHFPEGAETHPERTFEFSILPIHASLDSLGILLVDKYGGSCPDVNRSWRPTVDRYEELLQILGYEFDTYRTELPTASTAQSNGPDRWDQAYYDTEIWFTGPLDWRTLTADDQHETIEWIEHGVFGGQERNLLVTGNDIGRELMGLGQNILTFYDHFLGTDHQGDGPGDAAADTCPGLTDAGGGFMTWDDGQCILAGACPGPERFDVSGLSSVAQGSLSVVCRYVDGELTEYPAGVALDADLGYQSVTLGFGLEYMMDGTVLGGATNYTPQGYYLSGISDRSGLLGSIMEHFGKPVPNEWVGVPGDQVRVSLAQAIPNPLNSSTKIGFSVVDGGRVRIEVYNVAGRVVRTLLDDELPAGSSGFVVWDGRGAAGEECASGVYFYSLTAPGLQSSRRMVLLK